ncbi:kinase-like domain-containing protein, partial [Trichophaea hybrida]
DLIAFLSVVQKYNVGYLPVTWQHALNDLGKGGSGTISQSTFNTAMHLAFKRFHGNDDSDTDFLPLIAEVLILSQPAIQMHPNIVDLEGYCWEIKPRTEKAVPVLVFEKAAWDLEQFMNVSESRNMSMYERLNLCADIGSAIWTLHAYNIIHGDIKPQNVLIFKDATGKTTVKVADFGYSTLTAGARGKVYLPKSRPWNAPEHHVREFTAPDAKLTDVYSFGMLCLWVV